MCEREAEDRYTLSGKKYGEEEVVKNTFCPRNTSSREEHSKGHEQRAHLVPFLFHVHSSISLSSFFHFRFPEGTEMEEDRRRGEGIKMAHMKNGIVMILS